MSSKPTESASQNREKSAVSKDVVFDSITKAALDFYKVIVTVGSAFLGGSLIFVEKIAPHPSRWSLWLLVFGWLSLITSIVAIAFVERYNLESGRHVLESRVEEAANVDRRTRRLSTLAVWTLAAGIFCLAAFGFVNLLLGRENSNMSKEKETTTLSNLDGHAIPYSSTVEKSIPYASTQPSTQPPPAEPSTPAPSSSQGQGGQQGQEGHQESGSGAQSDSGKK